MQIRAKKLAAIRNDDIFVGRKVYIKTSEYSREDYGGQEYVETEVSWVGNRVFKVKNDRNKYVTYNLHTMYEAIRKVNRCQIVLNLPGEKEVSFERKKKLLIKVRAYFNSRAALEESEENLEKVIELLKL